VSILIYVVVVPSFVQRDMDLNVKEQNLWNVGETGRILSPNADKAIEKVTKNGPPRKSQ
jgi:hypothetical protein